MFQKTNQFSLKSGVQCGALLLLVMSQMAVAKNLCVNPGGSKGCYAKIQNAVNHAAANDVINIERGTYKEDVVIGIPLSLIGEDTDESVIDATGLANGIFADGLHNPGLHNVTVAGLTVRNALYEAILLVNVSGVIIRNNKLLNNDKYGPVFSTAMTGCPGQPAFETDETGDCGGALHLMGVVDSIVSGNLMSGNSDGILMSDETGQTSGNLITRNKVTNNPLDCGLTLASHPPVGHNAPPFAPHFGVHHNTLSENVVSDNGVQVQGAGVGMFSDGAGQGRMSDNLIIHNTLTGNGSGGVDIHSHVGPAFGLPADDMSGNLIIGNYIAGNLADSGDTATPGRVGININSGNGGSPILGTVITQNVIRDEDVDVAINTPAAVDVHLNSLLGGKVGVADVCVFDGNSANACTGTTNAIQNYWGCAAGPGANACTTASGTSVISSPWLPNLLDDDSDHDHR
jgi:hypothetical protein